MPTDRPTFPLICSELKNLSSAPNRHVVLKTSRDEFTPGYVSDNGQVFLRFVPHNFFQPGLFPARRSSNPVSPADDTIYSRETAESLVYLVSSEVESTYTTRETEYDDEIRGQSLWEIETEREGEDGTLLMEREGNGSDRDGRCSDESHDEIKDKDGSTEGLVYF